jgi:endogenous inhibitor of DNA gyrase (YacG/DUF329 family)|tara:strand:- start:940 stop:2880 length:1941 start_codon:yes stop_codon:yes gene_type:complete
MVNVVCAVPECSNTLPKGQRKFCSDKCRQLIDKRKWRAKQNGEVYILPEKKSNLKANEPKKKSTAKDGRASARRGETYEYFVKDNMPQEILNEELNREDAAKILKVSKAQVSRFLAAYQEDLEVEKAQTDWDVPEAAIQSLDSFKEFRDRYFLTERGVPFETADFHDNWIKSINKAIEEGGQQMILSPPRHGKTELLIHFAIWQICRNPNVRIMWVGGNEDIAKNSVSSVIDTLESNDRLKEDFCGPMGSFKPRTRTGKSWSQNGFTVSTRTVHGIKSPTMIGIGKGGKILSRDCDIIIADDIEDHATTAQPSARRNTKMWWTTTLASRKEEHTAIIVIGSRQHPEDLYSSLLDSEAWETIVEEAHDSSCEIPELNEEEHVDCMLWTGFRSYKWLISRKRDAMTTGGQQRFEMVYMNRPGEAGANIFDVESITNCMDRSINIGNIPKNSYLVAGLDPAATGYQAAFLWAILDDGGDALLQMVDVENQQGGGIDEALRVIKEWHQKYDLYHWVIEENNFQKAIRQDPRIKEFANKTGVQIEGHETYKNKWDSHFGVSSLAPMFNDKLIRLPYGNTESQVKTEMYRKQLMYFAMSGSNKYKSDIVMASWFPMKVFRKLQKAQYAEIGIDYIPSYKDFDVVEWNEAPWS